MKIAWKGVFLTGGATLLVGAIGLVPCLVLFPRSMRNVYQLPLLPSLLFLAFGVFLNLFAGWFLARHVNAEDYFLSSLITALFMTARSLTSGVGMFLISFAVCVVVMFLGKLLAGRRH